MLHLAGVLASDGSCSPALRTSAIEMSLKCAPGRWNCHSRLWMVRLEARAQLVLIDNWVGPNSVFYTNLCSSSILGIGLRLIPAELTLLTLDAAHRDPAVVLDREIGAIRGGRFWWFSGVITLFGDRCSRRRVNTRHLRCILVLALFAYPRGMFFIGCAFFLYSLYALRDNIGDRLLLAKATFGIFALALAVRVLGRSSGPVTASSTMSPCFWFS